MSGEVVFAVEDELAEVAGGLLEESGPVDAVENVKAGLGFIAGGDPDVEAGVAMGGFEEGVVGVGVGDANLAGFLDEFEGRLVENPGALVGEEVFLVRAYGAH